MKLFISTKICIFFIILSNNSLIFASRFTPKQKAEAVQMVRDGQTFASVGMKVNTSPRNVNSWVRAEEERTGEQIAPKQSQQQFTPEQKEEAVQMVRDGQIPSDVAREMNISRQNIHNWVQAKKQRTREQVVLQKEHFTPKEKAEAIQILKEEIEDITMNLPNFIPDVLNNLKNLFKRYLYNEIIFLEGAKKEFLTLLEEVEQELSLDERIDLKTRIEIDNHMKDIKYLISSSTCQVSLQV